MFAGAQIVTTKLARPSNEKQIHNAPNEDKTAKDMVNMTMSVPRSKIGIVVENSAEKLERKELAHERKHQRLVEQQKLAQQMETLMEKVLRETTLSKKDEHHLRTKIKTIVAKVNKESDRHSKSESVEQTNAIQTDNQGAFLLWYDKKFH